MRAAPKVENSMNFIIKSAFHKGGSLSLYLSIRIHNHFQSHNKQHKTKQQKCFTNATSRVKNTDYDAEQERQKEIEKDLETSPLSFNPLIRMHSDFNSDSNFDFSFSSALQVLWRLIPFMDRWIALCSILWSCVNLASNGE